uniref:transcription factor Jun-like n=1 Tax=Myxine glutinosa TaxID=7769 RepID=UPI00358F5CD0
MTAHMEAPFYHDDTAFGQPCAFSPYGHKMLQHKDVALSLVEPPVVLSKATQRPGNYPPMGTPIAQASEALLKLRSSEAEGALYGGHGSVHMGSGQGVVPALSSQRQCVAGGAQSYSIPGVPKDSGGSNEPESFTDGFVQALEELHKQGGHPAAVFSSEGSYETAGGTQTAGPGCVYHAPSGLGDAAPSYAELNVYRPNTLPPLLQQTLSGTRGVLQHFGPATYLTPQHQYPAALKEEPQTVPESSRGAGSGGGGDYESSTDMDSQDIVKTERKRLRNRIAASKCRRRKLERIARLEERVASLKAQNLDLAGQAGALRDQVCRLKRRVVSHLNRGCHLIMAPQLTEAF